MLEAKIVVEICQDHVREYDVGRIKFDWECGCIDGMATLTCRFRVGFPSGIFF